MILKKWKFKQIEWIRNQPTRKLCLKLFLKKPSQVLKIVPKILSSNLNLKSKKIKIFIIKINQIFKPYKKKAL